MVCSYKAYGDYNCISYVVAQCRTRCSILEFAYLGKRYVVLIQLNSSFLTDKHMAYWQCMFGRGGGSAVEVEGCCHCVLLAPCEVDSLLSCWLDSRSYPDWKAVVHEG